jgi:hypothetical protein
MVVALTQAVEYQGTHIVEGGHFVVVWLIRINTKGENEVKERLLRVGNQEVDCVSKSIGSKLSENFVSIDLIIILFSIIIIYLSNRLLITICHSLPGDFFSELSSAHGHPSVPYLSEFLLSSAYLLLLFFGLNICHNGIFSLSKLKQLKSLLLFDVSISLEFLYLSVYISSLLYDHLQHIDEGLYYN